MNKLIPIFLLFLLMLIYHSTCVWSFSIFFFLKRAILNFNLAEYSAQEPSTPTSKSTAGHEPSTSTSKSTAGHEPSTSTSKSTAAQEPSTSTWQNTAAQETSTSTSKSTAAQKFRTDTPVDTTKTGWEGPHQRHTSKWNHWFHPYQISSRRWK